MVVSGGGIQINNAGQIAGTMRDPNNHHRAFLWDPNSGRCVLPTLGGKNAFAMAINNLGQVVGESYTASGAAHAFVWDAVNGIRDLTPSSPRDTDASSINDSGQVVVWAGSTTLLVSAQKDSAVLSSQPAPLHPAFHINNAGAITSWSRGRLKVDFLVWHPDSGVRKVAQLRGCVKSDGFDVS